MPLKEIMGMSTLNLNRFVSFKREYFRCPCLQGFKVIFLLWHSDSPRRDRHLSKCCIQKFIHRWHLYYTVPDGLLEHPADDVTKLNCHWIGLNLFANCNYVHLVSNEMAEITNMTPYSFLVVFFFKPCRFNKI